jgi:hypothetical protein
MEDQIHHQAQQQKTFVVMEKKNSIPMESGKSATSEIRMGSQLGMIVYGMMDAQS